MANYINSEILSEAYSHLDIEIYNDKEKLKKLENELSAFFLERATFLFGNDVRIEIEFERGSLRTKIKVLGGAALIVGSALITYGSFRQAMDYLAKDATLLAESANLEMIYRTKAAHCDRVAIEKRRGIFGRVDTFLGELDLINRTIASEINLPTNARALKEFNGHLDRLNTWQKQTNKLMGKLTTDSTRACIAAGLLEELERFPSKAPWADKLEGESFRATLTKSDPELAGNVAGAAKRFEETVKYTKKYFEQIVKQYAPQKS